MENSRVKVVEIGKTVDFQGEGVNTKKGKFQGGGHDKIAWKSRVSASKIFISSTWGVNFCFS